MIGAGYRLRRAAVTAAALVGMACAGHAEAHVHHRHYRHHDCLRFNKTTGTVTGAVAGGLLGHAILGGTGGAVVGAAGGGLAGHHFARNGRKRCH